MLYIEDNTAPLYCKVESSWISFKFKKVYFTAKLTKHLIHDNEVLEENGAKISVICSFDDPDNLTNVFNNLITNTSQTVYFTVRTAFVDTLDRDGCHIKRFTATELKCGC